MAKPVRDMKDNELYTLFRKYAFREYLGYGNRSERLNEIYEELTRRNPAIGFSAVDDTIDSITGFESLYNELSGLNEAESDKHDNGGNACLLLGSPATAGPGLPQFDDVQERISLQDLLGIIQNKNVFVCRVDGESMINAAILDKALLFVERIKYPKTGDIIVATYDNELYVKRLKIKNGEVRLHSENPKFDDIIINPDMVFIIHGVVRGVFQVPK